MVGALHSVGWAGSVGSDNSRSTACVSDRLPAPSSTSTRSPGCSNTDILRAVLIWSTPALVRVSDRNTIPSSTLSATQYVMTDSWRQTDDAAIVNAASAIDDIGVQYPERRRPERGKRGDRFFPCRRGCRCYCGDCSNALTATDTSS